MKVKIGGNEYIIICNPSDEKNVLNALCDKSVYDPIKLKIKDTLESAARQLRGEK